MTDRIDITHYGYRVTWSAEEQRFVATCLELPSLSWLGCTQAETLSGLRDLVREVVEDLYAEGEPVPEPIGTQHLRSPSSSTGESATVTRQYTQIDRIVPREHGLELLPPTRRTGSRLTDVPRQKLRTAASIDELLTDERDA
ncbi:putative RNase H-like HicB family nuclease [Kineosphaera limosa]|uniref:HicB family protein n=1 Tax=Kineosphaera limosa NBRC 100340 TaxID=1184609 RepID=K6VP56_9MICO|nr:hypothetical protein [Kineosphaera limosa]NYD99468.1 putative RNase H-like HicB family nuclease [Kineosphaera limosa]GAB98003.1 hypothetical protein KILIM_094_00030 [Kineosphaera limosa NBRC 100340]